jgi:hypothetical protein
VTVEGRADDLLRYGDAVVHPLVLRSVLVDTPEVVEYQVTQTRRGAHVRVVAPGGVDQAGLAARLADRRLELELTPAAKAWLADRGYDPAYGARPLRRLVAKAIGDELARRLLAGEIGDGDTVVVDADGDRLTFTRRQPAAVA